MNCDELNPRVLSKLVNFADMRGLAMEDACRLVMRAGADLIPNKLHPYYCITELDIKRSFVVNSTTVCIELNKGQCFFGYPSNAKDVGLYHLFRDLAPKTLNANTYGLAIEIVHRYLSLKPEPQYPGKGSIMVDAGAYTGLKAMHYADIVGPAGKVVAIEIDRHNCDLIKRNAKANSLPIITVEKGIWDQKGQKTDCHRERQRHTIAEVDQLNSEHGYLSETVVETDTLDNILDQAGVDVVDYLNIQVNGAELQALEGLTLERVRAIWVASQYTINGKEMVSQIKHYFAKCGFDVLKAEFPGGVLAVNRNHS